MMRVHGAKSMLIVDISLYIVDIFTLCFSISRTKPLMTLHLSHSLFEEHSFFTGYQ